MKRTPTAQPKVDITPETLYNFTKLMEQCAPLAALLENHKSDPSGVLESEMKGVSDMAKRHKQWSDIILVQSENSPRSDTIETTGR